MQSVPSKRTTNRLIRGNRTCVYKRHGSYSVVQDRNQGEVARLPVSQSFRSGNGLDTTCKCRLEIGIDAGLWFYRWDWQELVCAIGIAGIPGTKRKELFSDEFVACVTQLMLVERGHGSFDDIESPTGKPMSVGNKCKEEIECEFFGSKVFDPLRGSKSMVEPRKVAWDLPYAIRNDGHKWFFQWHDCNSKWLIQCLLNSDVCDTVCCMLNRRAAFDRARKPKKLESFQLEKLSLLRSLGYLAQTKQSSGFAQKEVDSKKNIQQINKFRWKEDSKIPSFTTLY